MDDKYRRVCQYCNKVFYLNPRLGLKWVEKTNGGKFCSHKCYSDNRKGVRVSPDTEFSKYRTSWDKHPRFKTGIWSYRRFRKDKCEDCGSSAKLHVHHLDKNRHNNKIDNLKTLCKDCHWNYHRGNRNIPWNKGTKTGPLSVEHRNKISTALRRHYGS